MPAEKPIVEAFERIAGEIPGFIAASLVDLESGMTLGTKTLRSDFDLAAASAHNSEMVEHLPRGRSRELERRHRPGRGQQAHRAVHPAAAAASFSEFDDGREAL